MNRCTRLLSASSLSVYLVFVSGLLAVAALETGAQEKATPPSEDRRDADVFQKASFKRDAENAKTTCTVPETSAVTALVKNGVELSVGEDWDCDGVPDGYDNCVGMANASQADADGNGIGDACESAATVRSGRAEDKKKSEARSRKTVKKAGDRSRESEKEKSEDRVRKPVKKTGDRSRETRIRKSETNSRKKKPEDNVSRKDANRRKKKR